MSSLTDWINTTPERRRDYEQERLTVDVAENLQGLLDKAPMKRAELARRMGTSRQSLHQMLSGEQNLTLRTIAIMAHELGCRASVKFEPYSGQETRAEHCEVCAKSLPPASVWSMPSCPDCQELLEGLGQLMGDFADRDQTIKAGWIERAINLICARPSKAVTT